MSDSLNLSDPNHEFEESKHYNKVVFQQGKPILDVDLNDLSDALIAQTRSSLIEKMGFGPAQLDYREWAITSVDSIPTSAKNNDNFSFTLGRLDTHKGVIDTNTYKGDNLDSKVVYDYRKLVSDATNEASDRPYANYLFKGSVTSGTTTKLADTTKNFSATHRITGFDSNIEVSSDYASYVSQINNSATNSTTNFLGRFVEGSCRVVFLTGNNAGLEREITVLGTSTEFSFDALPQTLNVGDEYVIVPANTLTEYRNRYAAKADRASSEALGLSNMSKLLVYVQVFEDDISSNEDINIESSLLGYETTHRTQLRWCLRVCEYFESIVNDTSPDSGEALTNLQLQHIFKRLSSTSSVEFQTLIDSVDVGASQNDGYLQTNFWRNNDSTGSFSDTQLDKQVSPFYSVGITPMHFFSAKEAQTQSLLWAFLKSCLLGVLDNQNGFNDVQILSLFHSESKTNANNASNETISSRFYPGAYTDLTTDPVVHAFLSNRENYKNSDLDTLGEFTAGNFISPPKIMHTQAQLSEDNMRSRTLFGFRGGVLYGDVAPLVFQSSADHLSFIDQAVLGALGLGYSLGSDALGNRISSYYDFTAPGSSTLETQSGYGDGAVKMVDVLNNTTPSYTLRDRGTRSNHTVSSTDEDLGWSFYRYEGASLVGDNNETEISRRQWDQGIGQAVALRDSINFRKLAIKTSAHKSMDMFTISPRPLHQVSNNFTDNWETTLDTDVLNGRSTLSTTMNVPFLLPFNDENDNEVYSAYRDTYSGLGREVGGNIPAYNANLFMPNNKTLGLDTDVSLKTNYNSRDLLERYQAQSSGVSSYVVRDTNVTANLDSNHYSLGNYYGPWGRFSFSEAAWTRSVDNGALKVPMDLWSNRCTAMRLRYHIGDFYPNGTDSRGIPKNLLVDTLNLFVRIEPLSLTHWMTMPKHQHSILENSLVLADGVEALLNVSHGLGDTQKLINGSGQPLLQNNSPYTNDNMYDSSSETHSTRDTPVDNIDPMDLPFGHENQPYVHWYHPTQNEMRYADYQNAENAVKKYTYYPKWGRRSLIIPAVVPFVDQYTKELNSPISTVAEKNFSHADNNNALEEYGTVSTYSITGNIDSTTLIPRSTLDYPVHATDPTDGTLNNQSSFTVTKKDNSTFTVLQNSISFPYIPNNKTSQDENEPTPVFLPASKSYYKQDTRTIGGVIQPKVGYNSFIENYDGYADWSLSEREDDYFPYSEQDTFWLDELGSTNVNSLPNMLQREFVAWSVPVMRSAIRTTTVAGIVDLVRTSFANGLDSSTLPSEYSNFTLSEYAYTTTGENKGIQVPAIGPDIPTDTLFVGDTGTALSQVYQRSGFMSPLTLGVGSILKDGGLVHNNQKNVSVYRDSFDVYTDKTATSDQLRRTFNSLSNMGLQIKLLTNCSFRILHARPNGSVVGNERQQSSMPKSLTEVFIGHNRSVIEGGTMQPVTLPSIANADSKPFIHLASMNKGISTTNPNNTALGHLYNMVSDSVGGAKTINTSSSSLPTDSDFDSPFNSNRVPNLIYSANQRTAVGDTYAADPFDFALSNAFNPSANPITANDNLEANSGIEIDLIKELDMMHQNPSNYNIQSPSGGFGLQEMMPTSAEMTLPGDHEIIFVLYTGHYGAKMYDSNDTIDTTHIPPVAGCHLTATIEVNRPSERVSSTASDEHHYGQTVDGNPVNTYSILSTK